MTGYGGEIQVWINDENGTPQGVNLESGRVPVQTRWGNPQPNFGYVNASQLDKKETIWPANNSSTVIDGDTYSGNDHPAYLSAEGNLYFRSTSALDTAAGTGAQRIKVDYLKEDFTPVTVIKDTAGLTPVLIAADVYRVNRSSVYATGSTGKLQGNLVYHSQPAGNDDDVYFWHEANRFVSFVGIYTVPKDKVLLVHRWAASMGNATVGNYSRIVIACKQDDAGNALDFFVAKDGIVAHGVAGSSNFVMDPPYRIIAGIDIRLTAQTSVSNAVVTGSFWGELIDA